MKFDIQAIQIGTIQFNKEEIKKALEEQLKKYENLVISDESQVAEFKKIRANLNSVIKSFDGERLRIKKEFCEPLIVFESDVKELTEMITKIVGSIDSQIKYYDDLKRKEKTKDIEDILFAYNILPYKNRLWNEKWLNVTVSLKSIEEEVAAAKAKIDSELATLKTLTNDAKELAELEYEYNMSLDLAATITKYNAKKELISKRANEIKEENKNIPISDNEKKYLLKFKIVATKMQITLLGQFLKDNAIEYEQIKDNEGGNNNGN